MKKLNIIIAVLSLSILATSCLKDLDTRPLDEKTFTVDKAYADQAAYLQGLAKIYSVMAVSGQDGAGSTDITGLDPGNSQFLRSLWNLQVVTTAGEMTLGCLSLIITLGVISKMNLLMVYITGQCLL